MSSVIPEHSSPKVQGQKATPDKEKRGFWQRRLIQPIRNQLTQGVSVKAIAIGIAVGAVCGIFPVLGTTTVLTTLFAFLLKLNQPVAQAINFLVYPLHIALIPAFIRFGEFLFGADPIPFSISPMLKQFSDAPIDFLYQFKATFIHCITGWLVAAPFIAALIILMVTPVLKSAALRLTSKKTKSSL